MVPREQRPAPARDEEGYVSQAVRAVDRWFDDIDEHIEREHDGVRPLVDAPVQKPGAGRLLVRQPDPTEPPFPLPLNGDWTPPAPKVEAPAVESAPAPSMGRATGKLEQAQDAVAIFDRPQAGNDNEVVVHPPRKLVIPERAKPQPAPATPASTPAVKQEPKLEPALKPKDDGPDDGLAIKRPRQRM